VQPGDTLQKVANKELQDPGKGFFITAFNTVDPSRQLSPGTQLQIPLLGKDFLQKQELVRVVQQNNAMSFEPQTQGLRKKEKNKTTTAVSLDSMAEEMVPATDEKKRDAPDDSITYQKAGELLSRKEYHKSLQLLRSVDSSFRDVGRLIAATEAFLEQEADAHYRQGISYFLSEDLDKAIVEWEEALRLWPTHLKAQKDLRNVRKMQQRMNK
jgi:tetratricopeptide (TPR) repeat protein